MIQQELKPGMDGRGLDHMVVIQYEHDGPIVLEKIVDQEGGNRLVGELLRCVEQLQRRLTHRSQDRLAGRDQVRPEPDRVVVAFVQRHPGHRLLALGHERA